MQYEIKHGEYKLWKNKDRTEENKQPHYKGQGKNLEGHEEYISLWKNKAENGNDYLTIRVRIKANTEKKSLPKVDLEDDIPF